MGVLKSRIGSAIVTTLLILVLLVGTVGYIGWYNLLREVDTYIESPAEHFKYGSIGTENDQGVPYWIWEVLPRLFPEHLPGPNGYTSLGFTWEEGKETPVGVSKKTIGFPRQGITCAVCHSATYRKAPEDIPTVVPAGPSVKFNSLGYVRFLKACAQDPRFTADYILPEIEYNHKLSVLDKLLYRFLIIPSTQKAMLEQGTSFDWTDSRPDWGPGRIDPFNPVKFGMLEIPVDDTIGNSDMMSLWNQKQHQGFALHWDGLETSLTETVNTGALGDGATRKSINIAGLERVEKYISELDPPTFPFPVDEVLAAKGSQVFENSCAACHALGGERTGTVIPLAEIGTDRHRLDMWTEEAADKYNNFAEGYDYDFDQLRKTDGYLAVALDGLWLRAPYLHNGSVPNLQDLLNSPDQRPQVFYRGYDVYDPHLMGFVSTGSPAQQSGFRYETQLPGNSSQGHLYGTTLAAEDKKALIEYLKTL
ncbi:MAG: c-type cytochrome [Acaryochloridaceae cyanobacterium SU_2_1]|nr:c-type cytochrome [Acaryochloridaceae cyanobacterium SU_2_1]